MAWSPNISSERREAIRRAARAVVRLAVDPEATEPAHRQNEIVNDARTFNDFEAWDSVDALEDMVFTRGLVSLKQIEADRRAEFERRAKALAALMARTWPE